MQEGDPVSVQQGSSPLHVVAGPGRLGDVPLSYEQVVVRNSLLGGYVLHLSTEPLQARIRLMR